MARAATKADKVAVVCPKCGHEQPEPALAYSTVCKGCRQYFRVQDVLHPVAKPANHAVAGKQVTCFKCGVELDVALTAMSTMCKRCGSHVDLRDYQITNAVSKNFKTKGRFVIEPSGFLFNTESIAGEAIIKGRLLGQITAESLEIHNSAEIKGRFKTAHLILPVEQRFRWPEAISLVSAVIAGELVADLRATGKVVLKASARLFGNVEAGDLVVEEGAVVVGSMKVGVKTET